VIPEYPPEHPGNGAIWDLVPYTRGTVLDVGGPYVKPFPQFIKVHDSPNTDNKPDLVADCADLSKSVHAGSVDAVFSAHMLGDIEDYRAALASWWACVKVGGHLVLYLPHKDHYPNIGCPGANPDHKHDFEPQDIVRAMRMLRGGWDLVVQEVRTEGREYSFLQVFRKRRDDSQQFPYMAYQKPKKTACVVRYGGFGDMLQAANILPALKRQGYHVTMMTTPVGQDILRHDPHIDDWFIQDPDQVPNHWLNAFWAHVSQRFTRFINLCESVEGTLLAMPGRANHAWPFALRHARMNDNYLEFTASLAGVPNTRDARFYATPAEKKAARARLLLDGLNVVWALSGSSIHKFYPGQDAVIARLLLHFPGCRVFMVGDDACKLLELGWENESRVVRLSGELSIRETLALAKRADIVVGCETGVLNAVAFEDNRKVVLLSHSSHENLTKHWRNTAPLAPPDLDCYPCHRLHYTREFCRADPESGAALCQRLIAPERVFAAIVAEPKVEAAA